MVLVYFVGDTHQTMNKVVLGNFLSTNHSYYSPPVFSTPIPSYSLQISALGMTGGSSRPKNAQVAIK